MTAGIGSTLPVNLKQISGGWMDGRVDGWTDGRVGGSSQIVAQQGLGQSQPSAV